jgi:hypothetical protein
MLAINLAGQGPLRYPARNVAIDLEERRRRRDQRLAVQEANEIVQLAARGRSVTVEWASIAAMLALGLSLILGTLYRHIPTRSLAEAAWIGLVFGGLLAHAALQQGRARLGYLGLAIFAGLPLAVIPFRFIPFERGFILSFLLAMLGAGILAGALRWMWQLRISRDALRESMAATGQALSDARTAVGNWLRDATVKWIYGLLMLIIGAGLCFVGRQQQNEALFWAGAAVIFLIGSVGLWAPGVRNRPRRPVGLRHCGQLCFWLSLLVVPFVEAGPAGTLPYMTRPSARFLAMGLGLIIVGSTWFLQRNSIFSHHARPEGKQPAERAYAFAIVILGLLVSLAGLEVRQRMQIAVEPNAVSFTDPLGRVKLVPVTDIRTVMLVQQQDNLPIYVDSIEFQDNTSYTVIPFLFPGQQLQGDQDGLILALRSAAGLNTKSFPLKRVEQWTR